MVLDSRPSDAIALALRADCPIYVDMEVIKASRKHSYRRKRVKKVTKLE
jgi:bifunctional DNase/RNase